MRLVLSIAGGILLAFAVIVVLVAYASEIEAERRAAAYAQFLNVARSAVAPVPVSKRVLPSVPVVDRSLHSGEQCVGGYVVVRGDAGVVPQYSQSSGLIGRGRGRSIWRLLVISADRLRLFFLDRDRLKPGGALNVDVFFLRDCYVSNLVKWLFPAPCISSAENIRLDPVRCFPISKSHSAASICCGLVRYPLAV